MAQPQHRPHSPQDRLRASNTPFSDRTTTSTNSLFRKRCADCKKSESPLMLLIPCIRCPRKYHSTCGIPKPRLNDHEFVCGRCRVKDKSARTVAPSNSGPAGSSKPVECFAPAISNNLNFEKLMGTIGTEQAVAAHGELPLQTSNEVDDMVDQVAGHHDPTFDATHNDHEFSHVLGSQGQATRNETDTGIPFLANKNSYMQCLAKAKAIAQQSGLFDAMRPGVSAANPDVLAAERCAKELPTYQGRYNGSKTWLHNDDQVLEDALVVARKYKLVTCPWWMQISGCHREEQDCMFAHRDTGVVSPNGNFVAKGWTCPNYKSRKGCPNGREDNCLYTHNATGLKIGQDGKASKKHLTCYWFFEKGHCRRPNDKCLFAHHWTGFVAEDPSIKANFGRLPDDNRRVSQTLSSGREPSITTSLRTHSVKEAVPPFSATMNDVNEEALASGRMGALPGDHTQMHKNIDMSPLKETSHGLPRVSADSRARRKDIASTALPSGQSVDGALDSIEGMSQYGMSPPTVGATTSAQHPRRPSVNNASKFMACRSCGKKVMGRDECVSCQSQHNQSNGVVESPAHEIHTTGDQAERRESLEQSTLDAAIEVELHPTTSGDAPTVPAKRVLKRAAGGGLFTPAKRFKPEVTIQPSSQPPPRVRTIAEVLAAQRKETQQQSGSRQYNDAKPDLSDLIKCAGASNEPHLAFASVRAIEKRYMSYVKEDEQLPDVQHSTSASSTHSHLSVGPSTEPTDTAESDEEPLIHRKPKQASKPSIKIPEKLWSSSTASSNEGRERCSILDKSLGITKASEENLQPDVANDDNTDDDDTDSDVSEVPAVRAPDTFVTSCKTCRQKQKKCLHDVDGTYNGKRCEDWITDRVTRNVKYCDRSEAEMGVIETAALAYRNAVDTTSRGTNYVESEYTEELGSLIINPSRIVLENPSHTATLRMRNTAAGQILYRIRQSSRVIDTGCIIRPNWGRLDANEEVDIVVRYIDGDADTKRLRHLDISHVLLSDNSGSMTHSWHRSTKRSAVTVMKYPVVFLIDDDIDELARSDEELLLTMVDVLSGKPPVVYVPPRDRVENQTPQKPRITLNLRVNGTAAERQFVESNEVSSDTTNSNGRISLQNKGKSAVTNAPTLDIITQPATSPDETRSHVMQRGVSALTQSPPQLGGHKKTGSKSKLSPRKDSENARTTATDGSIDNNISLDNHPTRQIEIKRMQPLKGLAANIITLRAQGVQFEDSSTDEGTEHVGPDESFTTPNRFIDNLCAFKSTLDKHSKYYKPTNEEQPKPPTIYLPKLSKGQGLKSSKAVMHRAMLRNLQTFGSPHKEVDRQIPDQQVWALVERSVPSTSKDRFAPPTMQRPEEEQITFQDFCGIDSRREFEPCLIEKGKSVQLAFREKEQQSEDLGLGAAVRQRKRVVDSDKWPISAR